MSVKKSRGHILTSIAHNIHSPLTPILVEFIKYQLVSMFLSRPRIYSKRGCYVNECMLLGSCLKFPLVTATIATSHGHQRWWRGGGAARVGDKKWQKYWQTKHHFPWEICHSWHHGDKSCFARSYLQFFMLIISLTTREENIDGNLTNLAVFAYWFSDFFHHFDNYFLLWLVQFLKRCTKQCQQPPIYHPVKPYRDTLKL